MLFLDDTDATYTFKDKQKINRIIKSTVSHMLHFCFPVYILVNYIFEERIFYLSPRIAITASDVTGENQTKKTVADKFIYCKKKE